MKIKVLIVEDEMLVAEDIASDLAQHGFEVLDMVITGEECIKKCEQLNPDVVIMDINIKGTINGVETARKLNDQKRTPVVYLTASSDKQTLKQILDVFPASFISKPYNKTDLMMAIEVAFSMFHPATVPQHSLPELSDSVFVKVSSQYRKVKLADIVYIKAEGSYSKIYTATEELLVSYNLSHFEEVIRYPDFRRIHRSYIINIQYVEGFEANSLLIHKTVLPVSKQFLKDIMNLFRKL